MDETKEILAGLEPLYKEAKERGLWFHCSYQDLWFDPEELKELQAEGRFVWGKVNWKLRDPKEKLDSMLRQAIEAEKAYQAFRLRLKID